MAEMAEQVGPDGHVTGLDISESMVALAQQRCAHDRARMQRTLAAWNERFADPYLPRTLARRLHEAGIAVRFRDVLVLFNPEYDPDTYSVTNGRIMADFVVGRQAITRDENLQKLAFSGDSSEAVQSDELQGYHPCVSTEPGEPL